MMLQGSDRVCFFKAIKRGFVGFLVIESGT